MTPVMRDRRLPLVPRWSPVLLSKRARRMKDALLAIGTECHAYTAPPFCRDPGSGRLVDSPYGATGWCDGCKAREGLK